MQDSPLRWVAIHRRHHQFADEEPDPHSPLRSFFWAHMGWLLVKRDDLIERYAKDIVRDPFYRWLDERCNWLKIALVSWVVYFTVGFVGSKLFCTSVPDAVQFGASVVVWGAIVRTVIVWHLTWSVNSVTHIWGYRNYETPDLSRNNAIIAILVGGEGWHNNHHADQRSAQHGHKWWEFDLTWIVIRSLMLLGLAKDVALPSRVLDDKFRILDKS